MVKNDLIERYIYAVTKHMKADLKKDVSAELETIIQDMLEERCGDVMPTEHDIRVVLTELGTPAELALKYKSETQDCLIGQPYYNLYVYVLKLYLFGLEFLPAVSVSLVFFFFFFSAATIFFFISSICVFILTALGGLPFL